MDFLDQSQDDSTPPVPPPSPQVGSRQPSLLQTTHPGNSCLSGIVYLHRGNLAIGERGKRKDLYGSQRNEEQSSDCATDADAISVWSNASSTGSESSIGSKATEDWLSLKIIYTVELQVRVNLGDDMAYSSDEYD